MFSSARIGKSERKKTQEKKENHKIEFFKVAIIFLVLE